MGNARIKVSVAKMIALIEQKKETAIADFSDREAQAEREKDAWAEAVAEALFAAEDRSATEFETYRRSGETYILVKVEATRTAKPTLNTSQFDRDIAMLRLSADETIMIGVDTDLGRRYL